MTGIRLSGSDGALVGGQLVFRDPFMAPLARIVKLWRPLEFQSGSASLPSEMNNASHRLTESRNAKNRADGAFCLIGQASRGSHRDRARRPWRCDMARAGRWLGDGWAMAERWLGDGWAMAERWLGIVPFLS